jgi:hypothetical protein
LNNTFKNDSWINSYYTVNGETYRSYDNNIHTPEQIFTNELGFFLKKLLEEHNLELYYIYNEPNHKINFSKNDFNFFKEIKILQKNLNIPENIKIIRNMQYEDLLNFYNNYIFGGVEVFFVFSKMNGDYYYYDLLLAVKKNFNFDKFIKTNFNLIKIKNFKKISLEDLNFNYVQSLFNFEELKSYDFREIREDGYNDMMDKAKELSKHERSEWDNYQDYCYKNRINTKTDSMLFWYINECIGKFDESIDDLILFKNFSKNFGWLFFILSHEFKDVEISYKSDLTYDDLGFYTKQIEELIQTVLKNVDGKFIPYEEEYVFFGFYDMIDNLNYGLGKGYCIILHNIFMNKFKYGTTYKQRLRLFENKIKNINN